jgi:hypothetical protein
VKIIIALIIGAIILSFSSCERETEGYSIRDALKISAYVYDEDSGEDLLVYRDGVGKGYYWHNDNLNAYALERLNMNEIRTMAPMQAIRSLEGLNLFIEFDGVVEIVSEYRDIQVSLNHKLPPWEGLRYDRIFGFDAQFILESYVVINPINAVMHGSDVAERITATHLISVLSPGREYYLTINAYKFDNENKPAIQARLRFIVLDDEQQISLGAPDWSLCVSVELISYEYSDMHRFMEDIWDDEDYD